MASRIAQPKPKPSDALRPPGTNRRSQAALPAPRRPRVAIVGCRGYPSHYGGFETFVRKLAPHLRDAGVDVTVYGRGAGIRTRVEDVGGVRCVQTVGVDRRTTSTLSFGLSASLHAVSDAAPDVALVMNVANGFYLPMFRRAGIPTAVNVDGMEWERAKWNRAGRQVFRWGATLTARNADTIVVDSRAIGDVWSEKFGVTTTFIPYGADSREVRRADRVRALGIEPGGYVLAVARLVPENNLALLLDALRLRNPALPTVVVGSAVGRSPLEDELERLSSADRDFRWLGQVADDELLTQLWGNCAVYFHGHSVGGTNPALLQALGSGSPTIALDTAFNREVIDHPAHLCGKDPAQLAGLLAAVFHDRDLRGAMSRRGRAIVADRYRWGDVCDRYTSVLLNLARRSRPLVSSPAAMA